MPLAFDTTGLQRHDERTWFDPRTGDQVSLTYFDLEPDLPASLEELPLLRQRLAHVLAEAGTLVEAHVVTIDSVAALYQVVKLPIPGRQTGLMFVAALTVPKATGSVVLQVLCQEGNTSGIRESMVSSQIGFENCFPPHPYAPGLQGMLPWNVADDQRWDAQFPEHPLSRARAWAHRTIRTARVDPNFARLPPFRPADSQHFGAPQAFGAPADSQRPTASDAVGVPPEPEMFGSATGTQPDSFGAPPEPRTFGAPSDSQRFAAPDAFGAPEPEMFGNPTDSQRFTAPDAFGAPEPETLGSPSDSQRFAPPTGTQRPSPDAPGTPPEPQTFGNPTDSQRFTAPDAFGAPEPETLGSPSDSQRFAASDSFGAQPEPETLGDPTGTHRPTGPDAPGAPPEPQTFGNPTDSQRFTAPDAFGAPEPEMFGGPSDSQRFAAPDSPSASPEPQTSGDPSDSQRFTPPAEAQRPTGSDAFGAPPEPQTSGGPADPQPSAASDLLGEPPQTFGDNLATPDAFGAPPAPQTFGSPQRFAAQDAFGAPPEPQTFAATPESRFDAPADQLDLPRKPRPFPATPAEQPDSPPSPGPRVEAPQADPTEFDVDQVDATSEPAAFTAPEPEPVLSPLEPTAFTDPPAFTAPPAPQPPAPAAPGDVLHTVLVGVPIGDYLPLWQRDGQEDTVTFWRMSDPDAVRARLGTGVESRSAVDTGRYREAAMFSPERQMLFLMDRYRDDSGNLGGTSEQLFPATEEEAYQAADDKALSVLYSWLGEVVLAAVRRGEFVAIETGGWDVPVNPVVLVMLRTDGREWHSVVETSPVPVGAPVWRDQQPVEGTSQILASPATDQTLRASGLLTRFAINTWSMHPFELGISFGPNPTLEGQ